MTAISLRAPRRIALLVGILLIAANLRAPVTVLAPMLASIRADFGLSTAAAGALTTLPLLAFAVLSPFSALFARGYGLERVLCGAVVTIAAGIALRSAGAAWCLFAGTWVVGMGIAVGNVLLPSLIKRDFPQAVATMTSAYAFTMGAAAGVGSAVAVPLAEQFGWRYALAGFIVLPLAAFAAWLAQLGHASAPASAQAAGTKGTPLWRSALAWQVTLFLGLNSVIYYVAIAWLPTILVADGFTPAKAGSLHGVMQFATAVAGPGLWVVMRREVDHRALAAGSAILSAIGLVGWMAFPALATTWAVLFGLGTGAGIILGLTFVGLRSANPVRAAALSGMAQCVGYLLAATGPVAFGALHDAVSGWSAPLALCALLALAGAFLGWLAGRDRLVG